MILGLHNMLESVSHYFNDHSTGEGGGAILLLDGILLIPLIFAVFFYPVQIFTMLAAVMVLTFVFMLLARALHTHRRHVGHH